MIPAARALGRIDDARAHSTLKLAFYRTAAADERLVLAGALGIAAPILNLARTHVAAYEIGRLRGVTAS